MRKFKFMSKAVVGMMAVAMTIGSFSGVTTMQPIAVYAAEGDLTVTLSTTKVPQGKDGTEITFTAKKEGKDGTSNDYTDVEITDIKKEETDVSTGGAFTIADDKQKITVGSSAAAGTYTVTITDTVDNSKTATANFEVVAQSFVVVADETEATAGKTTTITFTAGMGIEGEVVTKDTAATYKMDYTKAEGDEVTKLEDGVLTIGPAVPADTKITVTATQATSGSATDTITISVKADQTQEPEDPTKPAELKVEDIDYEAFTITIEDTAAKYAFLEVWKFGDKTATGFGNEKDKKSALYSYKVVDGKVTVDLSFLKLGKTAQGIKVYTDAHTTPVERVIPKQADKLTLKWDGKTAADFDYGKSKEGSTGLTAAVLYTADFEYKGQYSKDWVSMADFKSVDHVSAGGTILVRRAATATAPAGPEAKVKIANLPKAPTPTFDYKNGTVKITDKMKYGYDADTTKWVAGDKKGVSVETLRAGANAQDSDEVVVFVFIAGDGSKKLDSNVASVILPALALPADNGTGTITCSGKSLTYTAAKIGKDEKDGYNLKGEGFESTSDAPTATSRKWKAIGSNKGLDVEVGNTIYIRLAGVKGKTAEASSLPSKELAWTAPAAEADITVTVSVKDNGSAEVQKPTGETAATVELEATVTDKDNKPVTGKTVTWALDAASSAADSGVSIDATTGKVTITKDVKVTAVKVIAEVEGVKSDEFTITIKDGTSAATVESVVLSLKNSGQSTVTRPTNETAVNVEFTVVAKDASNQAIENPEITWKLDDTSKADAGVSIDSATGTVTITKDSTTTSIEVTATVGGKDSNTVTITVN